MYFQIVCLSIVSVPMLCLKDPQIGNDTIHQQLLLTVGVIPWNKVAWVLATQKQEELSTINNHLLFDGQTAYSSKRERENL